MRTLRTTLGYPFNSGHDPDKASEFHDDILFEDVCACTAKEDVSKHEALKKAVRVKFIGFVKKGAEGYN